MRIDLPPCDFQNCRYCFDCNCTAGEVEHERCMYNYFHDAEMDERLVILPCKVGDTVYNLTSDSPTGIEETKVFQIRLTKNSYRALCNCVYDDWGSARWEFGPNDFGKTVFLTREAAEAALKGGTP